MSKLRGLLIALCTVFMLCAMSGIAHADAESIDSLSVRSNPSDLRYGDVFVTDKPTGVTYSGLSPSTVSSSSGSSSEQSGVSGSGGSGGDIFTILQRKIYNTLVDLRSIVYMIAGFGLAAFAVAAIFNKISYKHLGYIMVSLCLLSLMFPFLEYFSGETLESAQQKQLTFKNFLAASDYSRIRGTMDSDVLDGNGEAPINPSEHNILLGQEGYELDSLVQGINVEDKGLQLPENMQISAAALDKERALKQAVADAGCNPLTNKGEWDKEGKRKTCKVVDGTVQVGEERCEGKVKNGICKATVGQNIQAAFKTGTDVIHFGLEGAAMVGNTASLVVTSAQAGESIWNTATMNGDNVNFFDKLDAISKQTANTWGANGNATRDLYDIVGNTQGMMANAGDVGAVWSKDYENNTSGENSFTAKMDSWSQSADKVNKGISAVGQGVNQGAEAGIEIHNQANNVNAGINRVEDAKDQWNSYFHADEIEAERAANAAAAAAAKQAEELAYQEKLIQEEQARQEKIRQEAANKLTPEQIQAYLDSGMITSEQAAKLTADVQANKANQAAEAQKAAEAKAAAAQRAAVAAQQAVADAQTALNDAMNSGDTGAIAVALTALQDAQGRAAQANSDAAAAQKAAEAATQNNAEAQAAAENAATETGVPNANDNNLAPEGNTGSGNTSGSSGGGI